MEKRECPYCDKKFEGSTVNQVEKQLIVHKVTKHSDKVKIVEIKK